MTETKIALIDDRSDFVNEMATRIMAAAGFGDSLTRFYKIASTTPSVPSNPPDADLLELLLELSRLSSDPRAQSPTAAKLAECDLVLIDFDLRGTAVDGGLVTGERVAQLVRQFVPTGPVVSVDRRLMRVFDLAHRRPPVTIADFMLRVEDLGVGGLWGGVPKGYDPWYWPNLVETAKNYKKRVEFVGANYRKRLVTSLGIPADISSVLPGESSRVPLDLREATFAQIVDASVPPKEKEHIVPECRHRIAASIVGTWLQGTVLPPQDILMDAPHLIRQYPSLLRGAPNLATLNKLAAKTTEGDVPLNPEHLQKHRLERSFWLDRPVWWTAKILQDRGIKEVADPYNKVPLRADFAEDESRFVRPGSLARYESEGFFATRYVAGRSIFRDVHYEPRTRLAA